MLKASLCHALETYTAFSFMTTVLFAQTLAPAGPLPDMRYKADILVVVAHPDDETLISGYLAKAALDDGKRVEVVLTTRGNGGGNEVSYPQAAALADVREQEARRALESIGVRNVWFLDAPDTPARDIHNVLRSLETANHGAILGKVVRLMRLTRPDIVVTFVPLVVYGENHEDHQAAGVIATEAFDMAGDPTRFSEQVAFPDDYRGYGNLTEGLPPWQPQKLYYFSDALHTDFQKGRGLEFDMNRISPSQHVPYARLAALEASSHLTQIGVGEDGVKALKTGDYSEFNKPEYLLLGKSLVGGSATGDPLEGVRAEGIPFAPVRGYVPPQQSGVTVQIGGPWAFYRQFRPAHDLATVEEMHPVPEIGIAGGAELPAPLLIYNDSDHDAVVALQIALPEGWRNEGQAMRYPVRAHETYPVRLMLRIPPAAQGSWQELTFTPEGDSASGSDILRVFVGRGGM